MILESFTTSGRKIMANIPRSGMAKLCFLRIDPMILIITRRLPALYTTYMNGAYTNIIFGVRVKSDAHRPGKNVCVKNCTT